MFGDITANLLLWKTCCMDCHSQNCNWWLKEWAMTVCSKVKRPFDMSTSTHSHTGSYASTDFKNSTLTALSDAFGTRVQDNINSSELTASVAWKAREHLQRFKWDPGWRHNHPSNLPTHEHVDPHNILLAMLDYAPTAHGQRYAACAIVSCNSDTFVLVDLANTWLRYLLLVCEYISSIALQVTM